MTVFYFHNLDIFTFTGFSELIATMTTFRSSGLLWGVAQLKPPSIVTGGTKTSSGVWTVWSLAVFTNKGDPGGEGKSHNC